MKTTRQEGSDPVEDFIENQMDLNLDLPGLFYAEAMNRIERGTKTYAELLKFLELHEKEISKREKIKDPSERENVTCDLIQGIGGLEEIFGSVVSDFLVADILLVSSAEAYINSIAQIVLASADIKEFDKLSPVGKWMFLPRVLNLKWRPSVDKGCLQEFSRIVRRRNKAIHPQIVGVKGVLNVKHILKKIPVDPSTSERGRTAVASLFKELCLAWTGSYGPGWLDPAAAREHPPCFYGGNAEFPLRLGRPGET
ncbi:hypothetical protein G0Q06_12895 [Puniceicoccales bacterium CK1056]|uniref:Uncharacterized protein n=1 Tax=Oceanipulchritudo coccoides TaxID=2706888 RepID=A0A6B2M6C6_9BACT|nr:hypothetical protein [Oceanipulchritudo coccoides]NDV63355.1 hypothetical protein [Oceanipulchritudo coccoides]